MKELLLLGLIFVSGLIHGQPCKLEVDVNDPYEGLRKSTVPQTVWSDEHEAMVFVLSNDNGHKALELIHSRRGNPMLCLDEGSRIEIILEDGTSLTLENTTGEECADQAYSDIHETVEYILGGGFQIHPDEEEILMSSPVQEFRIYFEDGHDDYPLPDKVVMHEKGFDLFGEPDYPAHKFFIKSFPCIQ